MTENNLDRFFPLPENGKQPISCAVLLPRDMAIMGAVIRAYREKIMAPVFIGEKKIIVDFLKELGEKTTDFKIYNVKYSQEAIDLAIDMVYGRDVDCIMKGWIETSEFMHEILKREKNFCDRTLVSMISFRMLPNYHKLLAFTDTGICKHPNLDQKCLIIKNAVRAMQCLGVDCPKVACVTAYNYTDTRMPETIDAASIKQYNIDGKIDGCIVDGPMTIDVAINRQLAQNKGIASDVAGDADIIMFPDLSTASITSRTITQVTGDVPGILVLGAKVPIIVCSKDASEETKYLGIRIAAIGSFVSDNN